MMHILAPLAVKPAYQRQGIGGMLIKAGILRLRKMGSNLVFVLGHKEYYPQYGFMPQAARLGYSAPYPVETAGWFSQWADTDLTLAREQYNAPMFLIGPNIGEMMNPIDDGRKVSLPQVVQRARECSGFAEGCISLRQVANEVEKRSLMPLLLLADPSEKMIARYWGRSLFFVLEEGEKVIGSVLFSFSSEDLTGEIHNLAILPEYWRQGHGRRLMDSVAEYARGRCSVLLVGTAAVSETALNFYTSCGYAVSHIVPRFFTDNYEEPLWDEGKQCVDMVYLKKGLE